MDTSRPLEDQQQQVPSNQPQPTNPPPQDPTNARVEGSSFFEPPPEEEKKKPDADAQAEFERQKNNAIQAGLWYMKQKYPNLPVPDLDPNYRPPTQAVPL